MLINLNNSLYSGSLMADFGIFGPRKYNVGSTMGPNANVKDAFAMYSSSVGTYLLIRHSTSVIIDFSKSNHCTSQSKLVSSTKLKRKKKNKTGTYYLY